MTTPIPHLAPGLWGVLATPFSGPQFAVDTDSLRREVQLYTALPATGMVVLGVFGEGASLDAEEQALVVRTVAEAGKDAPLVVGLSARSTAVALEQARTAVKAAGSNLAALMVQANSSDPASARGPPDRRAPGNGRGHRAAGLPRGVRRHHQCGDRSLKSWRSAPSSWRSSRKHRPPPPPLPR